MIHRVNMKLLDKINNYFRKNFFTIKLKGRVLQKFNRSKLRDDSSSNLLVPDDHDDQLRDITAGSDYVPYSQDHGHASGSDQFSVGKEQARLTTSDKSKISRDVSFTDLREPLLDF